MASPGNKTVSKTVKKKQGGENGWGVKRNVIPPEEEKR